MEKNRAVTITKLEANDILGMAAYFQEGHSAQKTNTPSVRFTNLSIVEHILETWPEFLGEYPYLRMVRHGRAY